MPKIIVVGIFSILVIGIVVGGSLLVWQKIHKPQRADQSATEDNVNSDSQFGSLPKVDQSGEGPVNQPAGDNQDDDNDGLTNSDE